ncbi:MAG: right-handed parallel beta-helix repeat-containing protein [Lachnospiraceae bacterium]|jgi:hypothetical protein|nr:right-handed parallel beta-helix repeat-containing protein [uncultured Acetatifactor sp.]MCI9221044.1 right-handed parallel beta-helix repeat-containing protein [Lachnospiraceae bacterium]
MRKLTKKFYAILLTAAMAGSLIACGGEDAAPSGGSSENSTASDRSSEAESNAPSSTEEEKESKEDETAKENGAAFLYVATEGSDANDGSLEKPFATLSAAIEAARGIEGTVVINLRGGSYQATETIEMTEADSDLVIRSYPGETAEITGGTKIPFTAFSQVIDGEILERIDTVPSTLRDDGTPRPQGMDGYGLHINVLQADLKALGITDFGVVHDPDSQTGVSLMWEDSMMPLACYPNDGYLPVDNVFEKEAVEEGAVAPTIFTVQGLDGRYERWDQAEEVWVSGFTNSSYRTNTLSVEIDEEGKVSVPGGDSVRPSGDMGAKGIKIMNLMEELDAEREWYLDRETGYLYIIPPKDFGTGDELVFNNYKTDFLHITSAKNVVLQGLRFANTMSKAIVVEESDNIVIDACEFTDIGTQALGIYHSTNCGIRNSSIHNLASQAIGIVSCGDRKSLTSGGCFINNNLIELTCQKVADKYCIDINDCVGVTVSHNEIHDVPVWGIIYNDSNDITIEYNNLYKICHSGGDCGAIYCGRNWTTRGNVVRYNYIHGDLGTESYGVYLDDLHSSTEVYGNVFQKVQYGCRIGGGRDNKFINNLIVDCMFAVLANGDNMENPWCEEDGYLMERLREMPYTEGIWAERYPELVNILEDEPPRPKGNIITNNVQYLSDGRIQEYGGLLSDKRGMDDEFIEYSTIENNLTLDGTDSFANYALNDFTVLEGSELKTKLPEFEIIPFKEIGRQAYTLEDNYGKD